ncbi:dihydropteroate synthase [Herbiconiux sp. L3-i23]|nr:dihydropteroate synthase [Herbiconiux sp. L3-i23]
MTPDSFSDGGEHLDFDAAVAHAEAMVAAGADIIDIGGESTRPGAERVDPEIERARVLPVVVALAERGIEVSVDTMNASTALAAVRSGASIINDVSGGLADLGMAGVIAETRVKYIAMHWRGPSNEMVTLADYRDVPSDVRRELKSRVAELLVQGIDEQQLILDPGLGFAKDARHNWQLLSRLGEIESLGYPVLVGASRKRFVGALPQRNRVGAGVDPRDLPTAVISALAAHAGAWGVRVHDVASTAAALDVVDAWRAGADA